MTQYLPIKRLIPVLIIFLLSLSPLMSQSAAAWQTLVMADDIWSYFPGTSEPPANWSAPDFDDGSWPTGPGGIGYGDGDDATVIDRTGSLYLRTSFSVADLSAISDLLLYVDFDDGFVAYINGTEVARANLGVSGSRPAFTEFATLNTYEARLPSGGTPSSFLITKEMMESVLKEGNNVLALQVHNCDATSSDLSSTTYLIAAISGGSNNYRETPEWFSDPFGELSHLPLVVIETMGQTIPDEPKIPARMKVIDNGSATGNNQFQSGTDYEGNIAVEVRGQSSQMFPKKSYSIELKTEDGEDASASLLGMPEEEDWVLYAPYSDKSMMRNALTFHLGERMGAWQPRFRFCEVYLNGDYAGIYQLTESVKRDKGRVDISKLNPDEISGDDLTGGYILKVDKTGGLTSDEYFRTNPATMYPGSTKYNFTYVYPKYDEMAPEQKAYIRKYIGDTENALNGESFSDSEKGFRKYLDVSSFVDFQIIQELTNNVDGYRFSTFFYKDKESKGGKLKAGPLWDFDLCYGNEDYTDFNLETDTWLYPRFTDQYGSRLHWWARLMEDLSYRSVFISRWKSLRKGAFSTDSIMHFIDNTTDYLGEAVDRNFSRWPILGKYVWPNYFIGNTHDEELDYLKDWIVARVNWMDANVMLAENVSENYNEKDILVFPNPARDYLNLYMYLTNTGRIRTEIFDLTGRKAFSSDLTPESEGYAYFSLDVSGLAGGFYVLQIYQGNVRIGRRNIIISR